MAEAKNVVSSAVVRAVLPAAGVNALDLRASADPALPTDVNLNEFQGVIPLKNIRYLGRCFDLRRLDLLDLGATVRDGGGCMTTFAVSIPPEKCDVKSPDGSILIPRGTRYRSESRGERTSRAQVWSSTQEFTNTFKATVSTGIDIPEAFHFSASLSYEEIKKSTTIDKLEVSFVQGTFEFCGIEFRDDFDTDPPPEPGSPPKENLRPDDSFIAAVKGLRSKEDCAGFIQEFGTHYAHEVVFGGRMYQRIHISSKAKKELSEQKKDFKASAEGTYRKATASISGGSSTSYGSVLEAKEGINIEDVRWAGGTPNTDFDEWVRSVREDPKPMKLTLKPLYSLFTEKRFPGVDIAQKQQWMKETVENYLSRAPTVVVEPPGLDLKPLSNKIVTLLNRWGAGSNDPRVGQQIGVASGRPKLRPGSEKPFLWKLTLAPGKTDEFNISLIENGDAESLPYLGHMIGFFTSRRLTVEDRKTAFPWKFVPVQGKKDEYQIRCATDAKGAQYRGAGIGFDDQGFLVLYGREDDAKVVPWLLKFAVS